MTQRRKRYVIFDRFETIKTYEVMATDRDAAIKMIADGQTAGLIDVVQSARTVNGHRKEPHPLIRRQKR